MSQRSKIRCVPVKQVSGIANVVCLETVQLQCIIAGVLMPLFRRLILEIWHWKLLLIAYMCTDHHEHAGVASRKAYSFTDHSRSTIMGVCKDESRPMLSHVSHMLSHVMRSCKDIRTRRPMWHVKDFNLKVHDQNLVNYPTCYVAIHSQTLIWSPHCHPCGVLHSTSKSQHNLLTSSLDYGISNVQLIQKLNFKNQ